MKIYRGKRTPDAPVPVEVTVDGQPLPPRFDLRKHSPTGFEWGYGGSGPAQLALAILADHFGPDQEEKALTLYQDFKWDVVAAWENDTWIITTDEITHWPENSSRFKFGSGIWS